MAERNIEEIIMPKAINQEPVLQKTGNGAESEFDGNNHRPIVVRKRPNLKQKQAREYLDYNSLDERLFNAPLLTLEEEQKYGTIIQTNKEAKGPEYHTAFEIMVNSNMRLVAKVAHRYCGVSSHQFRDLFQEGYFGLRRAVEKFEPKRGYKFSTYAYWWIRRRIIGAIADTGDTIRLPEHIRADYYRILKFQQRHRSRFGAELSIEELAEGIGIPKQKVEKILRRVKAVQSPTSLQAPFGENQDSTLEEVIEDHKINIFQDSASQELKEGIAKLLTSVSKKEQTVLEYRFGLNGKNDLTLDEIAKLPEFQVTRERIRQIEWKALGKIKAMIHQRKEFLSLKDYLED